MNNCTFIGNITKDIDLRYAQEGKMAVAKFSVALNRDFKKNGENNADFINCIAFGKTAEFIDKFFSKGKKIAITSHVQTGSYKNKEGYMVYTTDFVVDKVEFVESKSAGNETRRESDTSTGFEFMEIDDGLEDTMPFA